MSEDSEPRSRPLRVHIPLPGEGDRWLCGYDAPTVTVRGEAIWSTPFCAACLVAVDYLRWRQIVAECAEPDLDYRQGLELLRTDPAWAARVPEWEDVLGPPQGFPDWERLRLDRVHWGLDRTPTAEVSARCALYRHFDSNDVLLYVGITRDAEARREQHAKTSMWAEFAVRETCEWFDSREEATAAEREAIEAEQPLFNRAYGSPDRDQRVVQYIAQHEAWHLLQPL